MFMYHSMISVISGRIDRAGMDLLLMAIGHNVDPFNAQSKTLEIEMDRKEFMTFEEFYFWWSASASASGPSDS